jgi:hypothetical protein
MQLAIHTAPRCTTLQLPTEELEYQFAMLFQPYPGPDCSTEFSDLDPCLPVIQNGTAVCTFYNGGGPRAATTYVMPLTVSPLTEWIWEGGADVWGDLATALSIAEVAKAHGWTVRVTD